MMRKSTIQNRSRNVLNPNSYGFIGLLLVILLLPNLFVAFLSADLSESLVKKFAYLVFSLLILLLPALFLKLRWYFLFESLFMLIAPFEIGYVWVFNATTTDGYISSLFHTNRGEAIELLTTVHWQIVILLGIWFAYYYIVFKKITNHYLFKKNASIAIGLTFLVFNLLLFGAMYMLEYRRTKSDIRMDLVVDNYINKYRKTYPCNIITTVLRIQQNDRLVHKMQKSTASFSYHAGQPSPPPSSEREIYMVIIGESARYENFSINGYARETSPLLAMKEGLLSYSDVYAASNVTEYALPLLLSRATPVDPQAAYREKTFVDAFRECGFYTAWIANQASYYPYIQRITNMVDVAHISLNDFDDVGNYDGLLLPYIDSVLNRNEPKTMLVVHTLGSHFRYNYRYPKSFEKFTPALQGAGNYGMVAAENKELLINSYDNTICYTDYILSEIINRVAGHNSLSAVIYVSDHAENLFDQGSSLILHGNKNPTVKEFHVPFLIWTSAKYQSFYENKQKSLEANIDQPLSVSNLFHTVLDMAGIRYPGETLEKSIASETFTADSIRYVYTVNKQLIHF